MPPKALVLLFLFSSAYADCPVWAVYNQRFGKCYHFYTQPATFLTAEKNCESDGGSLVSIGNAYENTFVSGIAAQSYSDTYWTGMNLLMSTQWSWTSGSNATYFNWAPDQPNDSSAYLCGAARTSDNQWTKELCSTKKPYMCQFDPHDAGVTPGACPWGYCPGANYTLNNNACKCYKYFFTPMNYKDAAETCTNEGATLAIVLSKAENYFLSNFAYKVTSADRNDPMIGLFCTGTKTSSCRWIDGTPLIYSNFMIISPNCTAVMYENSSSWNCYTGASQPFICQKTGISYN